MYEDCGGGVHLSTDKHSECPFDFEEAVEDGLAINCKTLRINK